VHLPLEDGWYRDVQLDPIEEVTRFYGFAAYRERFSLLRRVQPEQP